MKFVKPSNILVVSAVIIFIVSLFVSYRTIYYHFGDTYYVLNYKFLLSGTGVFFLLY